MPWCSFTAAICIQAFHLPVCICVQLLHDLVLLYRDAVGYLSTSRQHGSLTDRSRGHLVFRYWGHWLQSLQMTEYVCTLSVCHSSICAHWNNSGMECLVNILVFFTTHHPSMVSCLNTAFLLELCIPSDPHYFTQTIVGADFYFKFVLLSIVNVYYFQKVNWILYIFYLHPVPVAVMHMRCVHWSEWCMCSKCLCPLNSLLCVQMCVGWVAY